MPAIREPDVILLACRIFSPPGWHQTEMEKVQRSRDPAIGAGTLPEERLVGSDEGWTSVCPAILGV